MGKIVFLLGKIVFPLGKIVFLLGKMYSTNGKIVFHEWKNRIPFRKKIPRMEKSYFKLKFNKFNKLIIKLFGLNLSIDINVTLPWRIVY